MRAILISMLAMAACGHSPRVVPAPPPAPVPFLNEPPEMEEPITLCVYSKGRLRNVPFTYDPATGDSLIGGRRVSDVYPATTPPYVAGADWYIRKEPVVVGTGAGSRLMFYGLPRVLGINEVQQVGEWRGVPMFAEAGTTGTPSAVYLLVRPGCEFQPYQAEYTVGAVRG